MFMLWMNYQNQKALEEERKKVRVVVAAVNLKTGQQITQSDITFKEVKPDSVEPGSYSGDEAGNLIGGTLIVDVAQNQTILRNYLGVPEEKLLPAEGEREVTVSLKGQDAQDSFLRKGQVVSAFRVFATASGNRITQSLSKRTRILEVRKNDSIAANAQSGGESETYVTLAMSPEDAQKVLTYRESGEVKLLDGPNQEPPPSKVSLFQQWMGIEKEEKELTAEVGTDLISKPKE
jgi:Flp pilus assembly protein CpaB